MAITRAHLEEDTAKLVHATDAAGRKVSLVDFNRSGAPLMEIVTEPDIRTAEQARRYAEELQLLLRSIGASDADMERGQMRVEANVSLRPRGTEPFGTRVEVKNMNSFRSVERAIAFEIERQAAALDAGEPLVQETRGWAEERGETYRMRLKETSDDYRYFPEPDLPPLHLDAAWLAEIRAAPAGAAGRPPRALSRRAGAVGLRRRGARRPTPTRRPLFEATRAAAPDAGGEAGRELGHRRVPAPAQRDGRTPSSWRHRRVRGDRRRGRRRGDLAGPGAARSSRRTSRPARARPSIIAERGLPPDHGHAATLTAAVDAVIAANPAAVADYRAGKAQAVGFLVGQVMKATRGQANAGAGPGAVRARLDADGTGEG